MTGIVLGSIIGFLTLSSAFYLYSYAVEQSLKKTRQKFLSRIDNALALQQNSMYDDALKIYEEIAATITRNSRQDSFRDIYALCKYGKGKCFQRKSIENAEFYNRAIQNYEEFLRCLPPADGDMEKRLKKIETYCSLGTLYTAFAKEVKTKDQAAYLKRAETLLSSALTDIDVVKTQGSPLKGSAYRELFSAAGYAAVQQALGTVYVELADTETRSNAVRSLTKAVDIYDAALQTYTIEEYPLEHTTILKAKTAALKKLFYLTKEIPYMDSALNVLKTLADHVGKSGQPLELFAVLQDLGDSTMLIIEHLDTASEGDQDKEALYAMLLDAAGHYERMLQLYHEKDLFLTNNEVASIYKRLGSIKTKLYYLKYEDTLLEEGIALYQKALGHTAEASLDFALVHSIVGDLYVVLSRLHNRKENIAKAKKAYSVAIKAYDNLGMTSDKQSVEQSVKSIDGW
ncbi:MAG: hypothetical protein ACOYW7_11445 [Nitrospirota bacterium]